MDPASTLSVSQDRLLGGRVLLTQPVDGYRAAIDPVMLAAAVPAEAGDRVLDLGCGVGAAALCLLARLPGLALTGLEIQSALAALARVNAGANGWTEDLSVYEGSVLAPPEAVLAGGYDHVMTNPPYLPAGRGTPPPGGIKATANVEAEADLGQWLKMAIRVLRPKGRLSLIQRADRLDAVLAGLARRGVGDIRVLPLWPKVGRPATRVIVSARKGAKGPFELLPGLVLHGDDGGYTEAAEDILRRGLALA